MSGWADKKVGVSPAHRTIEDLVPYHTGKPIEELAREMGLERIVKLASNENPLGPPQSAVEAAVKAVSGMGRYPDGNCFELTRVISRELDVPVETIAMGNGSNDILETLAQLLLREDDETVYAWPAFIVYRLATLSHGGRGIEVPLDPDMKHDLGAMAQAVTPRTKMVFIANPNNPTGTYVRRPELVDFLESLPSEILPVLDEAYFEYAKDHEGFPDGVALIKEGYNLAVLRTFSKAYGLAGLRVGYAVMPVDLAGLVNRIRQPFNVNSIAQAAAAASFQDRVSLERALELNRNEMGKLEEGIRSLGLETVPSAANFLLVKLKGVRGTDIYNALLKKGVIVRPMEPYGLSSYIRVTAGLPEENRIFLKALSDAIAAKEV